MRCTSLCLESAFDPMLDGFRRHWDGKPRLGWLTYYFGAEDGDLTRAIGRKVLIAAIRRLRAGGKFDTILVLEAGPGNGAPAFSRRVR